jgi:hypothetical protein
MRRICWAALFAVLLVGCASRVSVSPAPNQGPSLIPKGTAIAVQPLETEDVVAGKLAHIDINRIIMVATKAPRGTRSPVVVYDLPPHMYPHPELGCGCEFRFDDHRCGWPIS